MSFLCGAARRLPLVLCLVTPLSIFVTYGVAVAKGHVSWFWPYISDTGALPPESCIFGLLLSSISFLLCFIIYVRYREVSEYSKLCPSVRIPPLWNRVAASLGFFSALGLHLVANFQEFNEFTTHIVGAMLCFFSATLYFFVQTVFTRRIQPEAKCLFWMRTSLTLLCVLFIAGTFAPLGGALRQFKGKDMLKWVAEDGGFELHLVSTFSEWLLVLCFCLYICTLLWDFRKIKIHPPRIQLIPLEETEERKESEEAERGGGKSFFI